MSLIRTLTRRFWNDTSEIDVLDARLLADIGFDRQGAMGNDVHLGYVARRSPFGLLADSLVAPAIRVTKSM